MSIRGPVNPSARSVSAALSPASEARTITMRPRCVRAGLAPLPCPRPCPLLCPVRCMRLLPLLPVLDVPAVLPVSLARGLWHLDDDRLYGARGGGAQHALPLRGVGGRIVPERFLAVQLEDARCQETTLGIGLAPIQVDHHMDGTRWCGRLRAGCVCACHPLFFLRCDFLWCAPCSRDAYAVYEL